MLLTLYREDEDLWDFRLSGPLAATLEVAWILHEATPCVAVVQHHIDQTGIIFTRVNAQHIETIYKLGRPDMKCKRLFAVDALHHPLIKNFRLAMLAIKPYAGPIGPFPRWRYTDDEDANYYCLVDTPTADLARGLASAFPTYVYQTKYTCLTYVRASGLTLANKLRSPSFSLDFFSRRGLPNENTCSLSPIQREVEAIEYPPPSILAYRFPQLR